MQVANGKLSVKSNKLVPRARIGVGTVIATRPSLVATGPAVLEPFHKDSDTHCFFYLLPFRIAPKRRIMEGWRMGRFLRRSRSLRARL